MKKELTIAFLMVGLTVGLSSTVTADEEETSVDVEISGVTQLDVRPSSLEYTGANDNDALSPGDARVVSDEGYEHIEVENIGSERIGSIYAQGTMHTEQPFGTLTEGDEDPQHNTGNFVTLSLDTAQDYGFDSELSDVTTMTHLNRVEYYEDNPPTYIQTLDTGDEYDFEDGETTEDVSTEPEVGRFRVGGAEYFFVQFETTSEEVLLIGDAPHTSTVLGTTDFTNDGDNFSEEILETEAGISNVFRVTEQDFVDFNTGGSTYDGQSLIEGRSVVDDSDLDDYDLSDIDAETREYNLYVDTSNGQIIRTRFNVEQQLPDGDSTDETSTGAQEFILDASSESESLQPGQNFPINFGVQVPLGVDENAIEEGTVTVISETYSDSE